MLRRSCDFNSSSRREKHWTLLSPTQLPFPEPSKPSLVPPSNIPPPNLRRQTGTSYASDLRSTHCLRTPEANITAALGWTISRRPVIRKHGNTMADVSWPELAVRLVSLSLITFSPFLMFEPQRNGWPVSCAVLSF